MPGVSSSSFGRSACLAVSLFTGVLSACEHESPGVEGRLEIAEHIDTAGFRRVHVVAIPRPDAAFDPDAPRFPTADEDNDSELSSTDFDFSAGDRSIPYSLVRGNRPAKHQKWRLFAWLTTGTTNAEEGPESEAPYGTVDFELDACPRGEGYCGIQRDMDVIIDKLAPP